jgi:hypothetical protein
MNKVLEDFQLDDQWKKQPSRALEPIPEKAPLRSRSQNRSRSKSRSRSRSVDTEQVSSRSRSSRSKSKQSSKATLSQASFRDTEGGLWRKKKEVRVVLPSLRTRDLVIELSGDDQVIETVLIPTLNDAVKQVRKMGSTKIQRCRMYLAKLLEMCINIAANDASGEIVFSQDASGRREYAIFRYNLWLLSNACIELLQSLGVNVQKQYGDQHELFREVYPIYFANQPPVPKHAQLASKKKKWWN